MRFTLFACFTQKELLARNANNETGKVCNERNALGRLELECVKILGNKCSFLSGSFLDSGRKKQQIVLRQQQNQRLPFQNLIMLPFIVLLFCW